MSVILPGVVDIPLPGDPITELEFEVTISTDDLQDLLLPGNLDQVIEFYGATPEPESLSLLNMWVMSNQLNDCVNIPTIEEDCSWNQTPFFEGGDPAHILYRPCKDIELFTAYQTNQVYLNPTPTAFDAINWTTPNGSFNDVPNVSLTSTGEYCAEVIFNQNCTVQLCEYICVPGLSNEIDPFVETLSSCATVGTGAICFKTEPLEQYNITLTSAPPGFIIDVEIGPTFLCYQNALPGSYTFHMYNIQCGSTTLYDIEVPIETNPIEIRILSQTTACVIDGIDQMDGELCVEASGGVAPYEYDWPDLGTTSTCITGLTNETDYTLVVKDFCGTESTHTVSLPAYTPPVIVVNNVGNTCGNANTGFIELDIIGDYESINWFTNSSVIPCADGRCEPSIYDLGVGLYIVEVVDRCGNRSTQSFNIESIPSNQIISITNEVITESCGEGANTGAIDLTVDNPNLIFQWSNGLQTEDISGLAPGKLRSND